MASSAPLQIQEGWNLRLKYLGVSIYIVLTTLSKEHWQNITFDDVRGTREKSGTKQAL